MDEKSVSYKALGFDLLSKQAVSYSKEDKIAKNRSFIRHDADLLAQRILELV